MANAVVKNLGVGSRNLASEVMQVMAGTMPGNNVVPIENQMYVSLSMYRPPLEGSLICTVCSGKYM